MNEKNISTPNDTFLLKLCIIISILSNKESTLKDVELSSSVNDLITILKSFSCDITLESNNLLIKGKGIFSLNIPENIKKISNKENLALIISLIVASSSKSSIQISNSLYDNEIKELINVLNNAGANITITNANSTIEITPSIIKSFHYDNILLSYIIKSSLLIIGIYLDKNLTIREKEPTIDSAERLLSFNANNIQKNATFNQLEMLITESKALKLNPIDEYIPKDTSLSALLLCLGIFGKYDSVNINKVSINPTKNEILNLLQDIGCEISASNIRPSCSIGEPYADLKAQKSNISPINMDTSILHNYIDIIILAYYAAFADGISVITSINKLRDINSSLIDELMLLYKNISIKAELTIKERDLQNTTKKNLSLIDKYTEVLVIYGNKNILTNKKHTIKNTSNLTNPIIALLYELSRIIFDQGPSYKYKDLLDEIYPNFYNKFII